MKKKIVTYNPLLKEIAGQLRKKGTPAERRLWQDLKGRQMLGFDFHRQKPIDNFIVDFYCPALMLAIEIDGSSHNDKYDIDLNRQRHLELKGLRFLRFQERDVMYNIEVVLNAINAWIEEHTPPFGRPSLEGK